MTESRSFFVVGVGRSGTSLLQSMLAAHSQLAIPPETGFLRRYGGSGTIARLARRGTRDDIERHLQQDQRLKRIDLPLRDILDAAEPLSDVSVYRALLSAYADSVGKPYVGDKDPRMIEHLDALHCAFASADVVHIIRDPRDVLASKAKADWSKRHSSVRHVFAYTVQLSIGQREGRRYFGERYHEIGYEQLLAEPEAQLRKLCAKLALEFEPGMLQFSTAAKALVAPDEMGWKQETMGPLLTKNFGKWRDQLVPQDVALVERACASAMQEFGYQSSDAYSTLTYLKRLRVRALEALIVMATPFYLGLRRWRSRRSR